MDDASPHADDHSGGSASWTWRREGATDVLHFRSGGGIFAAFDGVWRLESFLGIVDGLARASLRRQLEAGRPGDLVNARITFKDGARAHLIGAFHDEGAARGLVVSTVPEGQSSPAGGLDVLPVLQPIRRLSDLGIAGFEALARFRGPDGALVGPDDVSANPGDPAWSHIGPLMVRRSAELLSAMRAGGADVFLQVNLSAAEIARPELVEGVADAIADARLEPGVLRIELTEQAALRDLDAALGALSAFRAAGAGVVLDDFGAGHSSFCWLAEVPAEGVKLDARLVRLASMPRAGKIIASLIRLLRDLGMTCTAEGVENPELGHRLRDMGCDFVQGFAYDYPVSPEAAFILLGQAPPSGGSA